MGGCLLSTLWLAAGIILAIIVVEAIVRLFLENVDPRWIRAFEAILGLIVLVSLLLCLIGGVPYGPPWRCP